MLLLVLGSSAGAAPSVPAEATDVPSSGAFNYLIIKDIFFSETAAGPTHSVAGKR
jgi:hypothetical protein